MNPASIDRAVAPLLLLAALTGAAGAQHQLPLHQAPPELGIANYAIDATLDPAGKLIRGEEEIVWRNHTEYATSELWFHLYLNAFRDDRSTFARGVEGNPWGLPGPVPDEYRGWVEISSLEVLQGGEAVPDAILSRSFAQPDDGNPDDRTVLKVELANPVPPGGNIRLKVVFESRLPRGVARTGWVQDYFFGAQWFPKLGVFEQGRWNCHQYHAFTEYYADFGLYDVRLTVPGGWVVGGSGPSGQRNNGDGTTTYRFQQEKIHDFAWVASPRFDIRNVRVVAPTLPEVDVRLLILPEHQHLGNRYLRAVRESLRRFGEWFGPYPYPMFTLVDPAYRSDTGGMEYPAFVTAGASWLSPEASLTLESIAAHEVAHQWWYAVVASNEFEEAWLDEGLASWSESLLLQTAYPPIRYVEEFLGGVPLVFDHLDISLETINLPNVRRAGARDRMSRPSWQSLDGLSYVTNTYSKPELTLWTLQRLLGEEEMLRVLRTYFDRFAFRHPRTEDFIGVVSEVAGRDMQWFFDETFGSSELLDYAIAEAGSTRLGGETDTAETYRTEVLVRRLEGARLPVEVLLEFEDGSEVSTVWDGGDRWKKFVYDRPSRLRRAAVDPGRKLLLDLDPVNNSWVRREEEGHSPATLRWTSKWLFWVQNLLETFAFLG